MASEPATPTVLYERAQAAADTARHAADQARTYADQIGRDAAGGAIDPSVFGLVILVLSCFVGVSAVRSAPSARHQALLFALTALSSVIVVGALLVVGVDASEFSNDGPIWARIFGFFALILASATLVGGFLAGDRLLSAHDQG